MTTPEDAMISFEAVTKRFGEGTVVDDVTFSITKGDLCVLIGPSGAGKSTLLRMINRLIEPSSGIIRLAGDPVTAFKPEELRRRIGYAIQSVGLFPHWTVERNIAAVPRLLNWPEAKIRERVRELLTLLHLDPETFLARYPHQLSGGQAQRVGVARALAAQPDVLLMDEPFGALDPVTRDALQTEIVRIQRQTGTTIVFVTHGMQEAQRLATRIGILQSGRLVQYDTPRVILSHPANDFVARFIGGDSAGLQRLALETVADHYASGKTVPGVAVTLETSLETVLSLLLTQQSDALPVVDQNGQGIGAIDRGAVLGALASSTVTGA